MSESAFESACEKYPFIVVEWYDSYGVGSEWQVYKPGETKTGAIVAVSSGFLVGESEDAIKLLPHWTVDHDGDHQGCGDMTIPKCCIKARYRFGPNNAEQEGQGWLTR